RSRRWRGEGAATVALPPSIDRVSRREPAICRSNPTVGVRDCAVRRSTARRGPGSSPLLGTECRREIMELSIGQAKAKGRQSAAFRFRDSGGYPPEPSAWCPRGDSNPYDLRRYHLKVVRLPVPPPGQVCCFSASSSPAASVPAHRPGSGPERCCRLPPVSPPAQPCRHQPAWPRALPSPPRQQVSPLPAPAFPPPRPSRQGHRRWFAARH